MAAFVTVEDLATHMRQDLDAADTATATQVLDVISGLIRTYTGQTIDAVTGDVYTARVPLVQTLYLPQRPVTAVTAVSVDDTALVVEDDYEVDGAALLRVSTTWLGVVSVTYDHGYAEVPEDIRWVCLEWARWTLSNPPDPAATSFGPPTQMFTVDGLAGIGGRSLSILDSYRVPGVG